MPALTLSKPILSHSTPAAKYRLHPPGVSEFSACDYSDLSSSASQLGPTMHTLELLDQLLSMVLSVIGKLEPSASCTYPLTKNYVVLFGLVNIITPKVDNKLSLSQVTWELPFLPNSSRPTISFRHEMPWLRCLLLSIPRLVHSQNPGHHSASKDQIPITLGHSLEPVRCSSNRPD